MAPLSLMNQVVGHNFIKEKLSAALVRDNLPHALIFSGPQGIGKIKMAQALAQTLLCVSDSGCGECGPCLRVAKNQSESLKLISALTTAQIKIDQVRDILDFLSLAVDQGKKRVLIIDQAQNLNAQAANALLKILEEPPQNVFFILTTPDVRLLMQTIRSRCQVLLFKVLDIESLKKIKPDLPDWAYKASRGQVQNLDLFSADASNEKRHLDLKFFENFWLNPTFLMDTDIKETIKDRQTAIATLKNWSMFTRDLIFLNHQGKDFVVHFDLIKNFLNLQNIQTAKLYDFLKALWQAEKDAEKLDLTLLFESLWVTYARG